MGGKQTDCWSCRAVTERNPLGFQSSQDPKETLPEPEESSSWYVWEVGLTAPDGEDHVWLVPSGFIEQA